MVVDQPKEAGLACRKECNTSLIELGALNIRGPVVKARFLEKINRFVAVVEVDGRKELAHVPTSGRMGELLIPDARVMLVARDGATRRTHYDLIMVDHCGGMVSIDSRVPNKLLEVNFRGRHLPEFHGWDLGRCEVKLGKSRLDFLLTKGEEKCWVEAKSVTLVQGQTALFPDAQTERGARHLHELVEIKKSGDRAAAVFIIQRNDATCFAPNRDLDPNFAEALRNAAESNVEIYAYTCRVLPEYITIDRRVDVCL